MRVVVIDAACEAGPVINGAYVWCTKVPTFGVTGRQSGPSRPAESWF